jgi:signal transduction histidine kinase
VVSVLAIARDLSELDRAEEEVRRTDEENERLIEAGRLLSRTLDPDHVFGTMRQLVSDELACDGMVLSAYDPDTRTIRCRYAWVEGHDVDAANFPPVTLNPQGTGMQSRVILTGQPLMVGDVDAYTRAPGTTYYYVDADGTVHDRPTEEPHTQSAIMVPLLLEGQVSGVLQVLSHRRDAYTARDLRYLEALAAQMAAADHNATLYARARAELAQRVRAEAGLRDSEARLLALNETLEDRVREATVRLVQSHDELRESHDQMVDFSFAISHDLRAPLRAIRGHLDALLEDLGPTLDADGRTRASRIVEATERMDRLIRELLAYSRLGKVELAHEPVELGACVTDALALAENEFAERRAQLDDGVPRGRFTVLAHRAALVQAIWNLLSNAAKFVAPGVTPALALRAEQREGRVRLWVEDNGIGIAPEHRRKVFRVFERLHSEQRYAGTGIGLAMVEKTVKRMGGDVGFESEPGRGSQFWIEMPLAAVHVARPPESAGAPAAEPAVES